MSKASMFTHIVHERTSLPSKIYTIMGMIVKSSAPIFEPSLIMKRQFKVSGLLLILVLQFLFNILPQ
jgi:hypothetical protein